MGLKSPVGNARLQLSNNLELCWSSCMADGWLPDCACYFCREPLPPCRNKQNWHFLIETKDCGNLEPLVWVQAGFWLQLPVPCGPQWQLSLSVPIRKTTSALHRPEFTATAHWNFVVYFFPFLFIKQKLNLTSLCFVLLTASWPRIMPFGQSTERKKNIFSLL